MSVGSPWAAVAFAAFLFPPNGSDKSGLPVLQPGAKWVDAVLSQWVDGMIGSSRKQPEHTAMYDAIVDMRVGPGQGWFGPSESRLGWRWLAGQMDADRDGQIAREEFRGSD